ncbi:hypothetical protein BRADI_3g17398v3 [Brachypodium distachyon]|uniref:F-box domain-containing protein n=1 Tax=Brachypodium distachyon TaxID=15368 RepID=A0A0Q3JAZ6_BRADI|nr:hypothetical protein BRADI_3g17398v3 [Brachypodium distachyon]
MVVDAPGEWRHWAALPHDVLCLILSRIPQPNILRGAGAGLAHPRPLLWRRIDLADKEDEPPEGWQATARAAVGHSTGLCESFRGRVDAEFLLYLADSAVAAEPRRDVPRRHDAGREGKLIAAMKKFQLLERLVLSDGAIEVPSLVALLDHCPCLQLLDTSGCRSQGGRRAEPARLGPAHSSGWLGKLGKQNSGKTAPGDLTGK